MGLYSRIDTMSRTSVSDSPSKHFSVYKLKCNLTGYYYFGCTGSVDERLSQHVSSIKNIIELNTIDGLNFHKKVSEKMKQEYDKNRKKKLCNFIISSMSVEIMGVVSDKEGALLLEKYYIGTGKHDGLCCNVSGY